MKINEMSKITSNLIIFKKQQITDSYGEDEDVKVKKDHNSEVESSEAEDISGGNAKHKDEIIQVKEENYEIISNEQQVGNLCKWDDLPFKKEYMDIVRNSEDVESSRAENISGGSGYSKNGSTIKGIVENYGETTSVGNSWVWDVTVKNEDIVDLGNKNDYLLKTSHSEYIIKEELNSKALDIDNLYQHTNGTKQSRYECNFCDHQSLHSDSLREQHVNALHSKEQVLNKTAPTKILNWDMKFHDSEKHLFQCDAGEHQTDKIFYLDRRANVVHRKQNMHECFHCDYKTIHIRNFKNHVNAKHTKQSMHKCEYCDCEFTKMEIFKKHVNAKHTKLFMYKCDYCNYESAQVSNLKKHLNSKHTKLNMHKCGYCDYESVCVITLKKHINSKHTKLNMRKCDYCDYTTVSFSFLKKHLILQHGILNRHKCGYCDYKTAQIDDLKMHLKNMHTKIMKYA